MLRHLILQWMSTFRIKLLVLFHLRRGDIVFTGILPSTCHLDNTAVEIWSSKHSHYALQTFSFTSHVICSLRSLVTTQNSLSVPASKKSRVSRTEEHGFHSRRGFCVSFYIGHFDVAEQIDHTFTNTAEYLLISISLPFLSVHLPFNELCTYTLA
jgi:hypothetical protein